MSEGWNEWSMFVLKELERLNVDFKDACEKLEKLNTDMTVMKTKAVIWGGIAAFVISILVPLIPTILKLILKLIAGVAIL